MKTGTSERRDLPVALVVGGGGMGMATARRLGQSHRIILASYSAAKNAEREAALREDGIDAVAAQCDVTNADSVARLVEFIAARGPLRAIAFVAALAPAAGDWRSIFKVDLIGATHIERAMLTLAQPATAAVFVSSIAGHRPVPDAVAAVLDQPLEADFFERFIAVHGGEPDSYQAYALAKFALNRMCRRRAKDWGLKGARIVSMSPGLIATPMGALAIEQTPRILDILAASPIPREGTMVETSDAIEFLVSSRASFITGTDLLVDGGVVAVSALPQI